MSERLFRAVLGLALIVALYFELPAVIGAMIGLLLFEGATNWRLPLLIARIFPEQRAACATMPASPIVRSLRLPFEAERALRILVALLTLLSVFVFPKALWFLSWFVAFALVGSGLSGLCPMAMALRGIGFK